eukprot:364561-Chlamydomonas_euryale.AAC.3
MGCGVRGVRMGRQDSSSAGVLLQYCRNSCTIWVGGTAAGTAGTSVPSGGWVRAAGACETQGVGCEDVQAGGLGRSGAVHRCTPTSSHSGAVHRCTPTSSHSGGVHRRTPTSSHSGAVHRRRARLQGGGVGRREGIGG